MSHPALTVQVCGAFQFVNAMSAVVASVRRVIVTAQIQSRPSCARDAPAPRRDVIEVEAADFNGAKRQVQDRLPVGWIVAAWLVG